jgi:hypothetical protein
VVGKPPNPGRKLIVSSLVFCWFALKGSNGWLEGDD